jgi:hypothetical protein
MKTQHLFIDFKIFLLCKFLKKENLITSTKKSFAQYQSNFRIQNHVLVLSLIFLMFSQVLTAQQQAKFTLILKTNTPPEDSIYILFGNAVKMNKVNSYTWQATIMVWPNQLYNYKYNRGGIQGCDEDLGNRNEGWRQLNTSNTMNPIETIDTVYKWRWWPVDGVLPTVDESEYLKTPPDTLPGSTFHCGIGFQDWWWKEFTPLVAPTLDRAVNETKATWVQLSPTYKLVQIYPEPKITFYEGISTPDSSMVYIINECHKRGLKVMVWVQIWSQINDTIKRHTREWYLSYHKQLDSILCRNAKLYQDNGVDAYSIGPHHNNFNMQNEDVAFFDSLAIDLIDRIKAIFKNPVGVGENLLYPEMKMHGKADFLWDAIWQIEVGNGLVNPTVNDFLTKSNLNFSLDHHLKNAATIWHKKVIIDLTYSSYTGALTGNPNWESQWWWNEDDNNVPYNFQLQANGWEASLREIVKRDYIGGVYAYLYNFQNTVDKTPSIRAKPAEKVASKWFTWINNQPPEKPQLVINVNQLDFGSIKLDESKTNMVTISNPAWPLLSIDSVYTHTLNFKANRYKFELRGDDSIAITFKANSFGTYTDTLYLKNNSEKQLIKVPLKANCPLVLPLVKTSLITNITLNGAYCGGNVTSDGGYTVTAKGVCWNRASNPTIENDSTLEGSGIGQFTSNLTGLQPNTKYYVRAYAKNISGVAYGNEISFTTLANLPTLTTTEISTITANSAASGGNITSDGSAIITSRGVCWSTIAGPTIANNSTNDGTGIGQFNSVLRNLQPNTKYYVRAFAINSLGTAYGNEVSFSTLTTEIELITDKNVFVYPNPVNNVLLINGLSDILKISIYDMYGKIIFNKLVINNQIDISNFTSGIYMIKIETTKGFLIQKFIKQLNNNR